MYPVAASLSVSRARRHRVDRRRALLAVIGRQIRRPGLSHARGASRTVLFVSAGAGLGNRLRAWLGYRAMSLCCGVPFHLCWEPDWACDAPFRALFESPPFPVTNLVNCRRMLVQRRAECFTHSSWCDDIWRDFAADAVGWERFMAAVRASLAEIRFHANLVAAADRFARDHDVADRVGIHIRHTDNVRRSRQGNWSSRFVPELASTPEGFFREMDRQAGRQRFFVATDSAALAREVARRYPAQACLLPKTFRPTLTPRGEARATSVQTAVTELVLLGRCRRVIGTYFSSFSRIGAMLGGRDYAEIRGTRCVDDPAICTGPGILNNRMFRQRR